MLKKINGSKTIALVLWIFEICQIRAKIIFDCGKNYDENKKIKTCFAQRDDILFGTNHPATTFYKDLGASILMTNTSCLMEFDTFPYTARYQCGLFLTDNEGPPIRINFAIFNTTKHKNKVSSFNESSQKHCKNYTKNAETKIYNHNYIMTKKYPSITHICESMFSSKYIELSRFNKLTIIATVAFISITILLLILLALVSQLIRKGKREKLHSLHKQSYKRYSSPSSTFQEQHNTNSWDVTDRNKRETISASKYSEPINHSEVIQISPELKHLHKKEKKQPEYII